MTHSDPVVSPARLAPLWWPLALLAVVAPTLVAAHDPPSVTFYNQVLAVFGWGVLACALARLPVPRHSQWPVGMWAVAGVLLVNAGMALKSGIWGHLPGGLSMMGAGLSLAACLMLSLGWRAGNSVCREPVAEAFFGALTVAGVAGMALSWVQVFHPVWADGVWIAEPTIVGRAVGNLRQPNHLSTLLVWSCCGAAWLGVRRRVPAWLASALVALFIGGVVWTASRTGMVAMLFLTLWGLLDKRLSPLLRLTLVAAPALYGAWWGGMYWLAHLDKGVAFAAEARLHDGSDISSSRFKIWANVIELIRQNPWSGVGYGEFNVAWTLTPFPTRPLAFFDHTHNLLMQWAVEFGLPLALWMVAMCVLGYVALWRKADAAKPGAAPETEGNPGTLGAVAVIVALAGLHSLLEYPLWYSYFLLPTAFAWGLGLSARQAALAPSEASAWAQGTDAGSSRAWLVASALTALGALWCAADYQSAANIYAPRAGAGPLAKRVAFGQRMPWFGYQADYADATGPDEEDDSRPPLAFRRTLHNLLDARLMIAYARSLAEHGEVDKARYVVERLKEFRNSMGNDFLAVCKTEPEAGEERAFQCTPPQKSYTWRELLPD